jgi:hypothetical protein
MERYPCLQIKKVELLSSNFWAGRVAQGIEPGYQAWGPKSNS